MTDNYSEALYAKGRTEFSLKQLSAAEKTFSELVRVYPDNEDAYAALFALYEAKEGRELAVQKLVGLANRNAIIEPLVVLIKRYLASGELEEARGYYQQAQ